MAFPGRFVSFLFITPEPTPPLDRAVAIKSFHLWFMESWKMCLRKTSNVYCTDGVAMVVCYESLPQYFPLSMCHCPRYTTRYVPYLLLRKQITVRLKFMVFPLLNGSGIKTHFLTCSCLILPQVRTLCPFFYP